MIRSAPQRLQGDCSKWEPRQQNLPMHFTLFFNASLYSLIVTFALIVMMIGVVTDKATNIIKPDQSLVSRPINVCHSCVTILGTIFLTVKWTGQSKMSV